MNITPQAPAGTTSTASPRRLLIGSSTLAFLLAAAAGLVVHVSATRQMEVKNYSALANILSANCLQPLTHRQHQQAADALSLLTQVRAVRSASVVQTDGSILATYERPPLHHGTHSSQPHSEAHRYIDQSQLLIAVPIGTPQRHEGTLRLEADTGTVWSSAIVFLPWWAGAYALAFLATSVAAACSSRGMSRHHRQQKAPPIAARNNATLVHAIQTSPARPDESQKITAPSRMSEAAAEVLHNVGNVLNSVNVSVQMVRHKVAQSRADRLRPAIGLIQEHRQDLGSFLTDDARGRLLPDFLDQLSQAIEAEQREIRQELMSVETCVNHINNLVNLQQAFATPASRSESVSAVELMEDAITLNQAPLNLQGINLKRDYQFTGMLHIDRHKVLQILINLISNARNALQAESVAPPQLTLSITHSDADYCCFKVSDNGTGISPEHLSHLFQDRFTTRYRGHGYGLHSAALAARDLGGELHGHSAGPGLGAEFTLMIPVTIGEVCLCPA